MELSPVDLARGAGTFLMVDRTGNTTELSYPQGVSSADRPESIDPNLVTTTAGIRFHLGESCHVRMTMYDAIGRRVVVPVEEDLPPGSHRAVWTVDNNPTGVYFCELRSGVQVVAHMLIVR